MPLVLSKVSASEALLASKRIAAIHLAAFSGNLMLLAQFPTPAARKALLGYLARKTEEQVRSSQTHVLIVRDSDKRVDGSSELKDIIAFAKWEGPAEENASENEDVRLRRSEGADVNILNGWAEEIKKASERVLGKEAHYQLIPPDLTFLATDPEHERRGAATLLVKWGVEQAINEGIPAYLESTADAEKVYERQGFRPVDKVSMVLKALRGGEDAVYEETCYLFKPTASSS